MTPKAAVMLPTKAYIVKDASCTQSPVRRLTVKEKMIAVWKSKMRETNMAPAGMGIPNKELSRALYSRPFERVVRR